MSIGVGDRFRDRDPRRPRTLRVVTAPPATPSGLIPEDSDIGVVNESTGVASNIKAGRLATPGRFVRLPKSKPPGMKPYFEDGMEY